MELKELTAFKELRVLDMRSTQVTDVGLKSVGTLKTLKQLTALTTLMSLEELHLARTQVTKAGVAALQKARPGLQIFGQ